MELTKFFPLVKIDETTHTVYGLVTAEVPDKAGEICDYEAAKKAYSEWSNAFLEKTTAAGQEPSLGNIRLMHNVELAGKATKLEFKDDAKQIFLATQPVNEEIWQLVKGGFVTGFSHGGNYTFKKADGKYTRYGLKLVEVSYVDNPCLEEATFTYVKADGSMELRKFAPKAAPEAVPETKDAADVATGNALLAELRAIHELLEKRDFSDKEREHLASTGAALPDGSFPIETKQDLENAIHAYGRAKNKAKAKAHIIARAKALGATDMLPEGWLSEKAAALATHAQAARPLVKALIAETRKGMFEVGRFAELLASLRWLYEEARWEAEREQDESPVPQDLLDRVKDLATVFMSMAHEEVAELIADKDMDDCSVPCCFATYADLRKVSALLKQAAEKTQAGSEPASKEPSMELAKKASLVDHIKKAKEMADDHHEKFQSHLDKMMECAAGAPDDGDEDDAKKAAAAKTEPAAPAFAANAGDDLVKAVGAQFVDMLKGMTDQFSTFMSDLKKSSEELLPPKAAATSTGHAVTKTEDGKPNGTAAAAAAEPVFRVQGQAAEVDSKVREAMKSVFNTGGVPLA